MCFFSRLWQDKSCAPVTEYRYQNGIMAAAGRKRLELSLQPCVGPLDYQIFSPLINLW
ncbi:hypothetical protein E2C01_084217 [Portunus trituberculatus]|uniref:Uncharacterized protein n=1 Tax=Portunus trituberculatus TaxID=210409 RepID=A0A5B7J3P3_PORTR|nr:hypothetical protein [Portunus trituberculatus]